MTTETTGQLYRDLLQCKAQMKELENKKANLEASILEVNKDTIASKLDNDYGTGTASFDSDGFKVKVVISKKVSYDQDGLESVGKMLASRGQDPKEYIKVKLDVSETAYKAWPSDLKAMFDPYRTVETSKPRIDVTEE